MALYHDDDRPMTPRGVAIARLSDRANGGSRDAARELTRIYAEMEAARLEIEDWKRRQTEATR